MNPRDRLVLRCPAKVNLALSVAAPDASGLHPIASWMAAIDLSDTLSIDVAHDGRSRFDIHFDEHGPTRGVVDWPLEKDLSHRAVGLVEQHVGQTLPIHLTLRKCIPAGAGLGGGSSNAAAPLVGLNRLFQLGLSTQTLLELSGRLGSDVCFLLHAILGRTAGVALGRGETIELIDAPHPIDLVLLLPPLRCSTAQVYQQFDALRPDAPAQPDAAAVRALAACTRLAPDGSFNDLAEAACRVEPRLASYRDKARDAMGLPVHITGSGSAMFAVAPEAAAAARMAEDTAARTGTPARATRTLANAPF